VYPVIRKSLTILTLVALGSCAVPTKEPPEAPPIDYPIGFPSALYRDAEARGDVVYRIDNVASTAVVQVGKSGTLARFGHDHIVASHDLTGYAWLPGGAASLIGARADLYLPLAKLAVDEAELLTAAGLGTAPSAADIDATRTNMLKSLEADSYPWLNVSIAMTSAEALFINLTLHGVTRSYRIPADIQVSADELRVAGGFTLRQSDHGITPFSTLGGALSVGDELDVRFDLRARR
jgi:hypothetical protein